MLDLTWDCRASFDAGVRPDALPIWGPTRKKDRPGAGFFEQSILRI